MNKTFLAILLAVCVLGMALAMFSERLSRKPETSPGQIAANTQLPNLAADNGVPSTGVNLPAASMEDNSQPVPRTESELFQNTRNLEDAIARESLSEGKIGNAPVLPEPVRVPEPVQAERVEAQHQALENVSEPLQNPSQNQTPELPDSRPAPAPVKAVETEKPVAPMPAPAVKPAPAQKAPAQQNIASPAKSGNITNFVIFARDKGATIRFAGNGKIRYKSMTLENPDRVVVDLDGNWKFPDKLPVPKNDMVNAVRIGKNGENTRMVIDLKEKPRLSRIVEGQNGNNIDVRVDR